MFEKIGYEVGERLACDCWGELYEAVYKPHGTAVLFRRFDTAVTGYDGAWKLVEAELRAWSRLDHPGIISVLEWGVHDGMAFMAMRMPAGAPLMDCPAPLDVSVADVAFESLLEAMSAAGKLGVLHLGLSPANVWLDGDRACVADFGLWYVARDFPGCFHPDELFLAPEQGGTGRVGAAADVYSLGLIYVVMRFGVEAAREASARGILPEEIEDRSRIIERCLDRLPLSRHRSAAELALAFTPRSRSDEVEDNSPDDCPICVARARMRQQAGARGERGSPYPPARNIVSCAWLLVGALAVATLIVWWLALR